MNPVNDYATTLQKAARQANDLSSYLASFPNDWSVMEPLRTAASTIDEAARALGKQELIDLSTNLSFTANGIIKTERGIEKLNRLVEQILTIAESLTDPN